MAEHEQASLHCLVFGRVQGVGFRFFVQDRARELGLVGWVRNRPDGRSVEVYAEGPRSALEQLRHALHSGPPGAWVERVECTWGEATGTLHGFEIRRT